MSEYKETEHKENELTEICIGTTVYDEHKNSVMEQKIDTESKQEVKDNYCMTLLCSDDKPVFCLKSKLINFEVFCKIFNDEPELKEIKCLHLSSEIFTLLNKNPHKSEDIIVISKLLHYYCNNDKEIEKCLIRHPKEILYLYPGSELHFRKVISDCYNESPSEWKRVLKRTKVSDKIKTIIYDAMMDAEESSSDQSYSWYVPSTNKRYRYDNILNPYLPYHPHPEDYADNDYSNYRYIGV